MFAKLAHKICTAFVKFTPKKQNSRRLFHFLHSAIIKYQPPLLAVVKGRLVRQRHRLSPLLYLRRICSSACACQKSERILYFVQAASSQSVPVNKSKFHIAAMFVLCASHYAAPVKFTLFAPLYALCSQSSRIKFAPFVALASLHFREAPFRAANAAASVASKSAQI